jgi:thymidylate synthase
MAFKTMVTELLWFLRGDTNIKYLVDNNCHIWDGDAYKNYTKSFLGYEDIPSQEWFINEIKSNTEFAKRFGELGPVYGKQWRRWEINEPKNIVKTENVTWPYEPNPHTYQQRVGSFKITQIDQIANLINGLKTNPDSRRLMVNAWNVGELDQMVLPPCHFSFQCYSHEKEGKRYLSLAWNQRSCDVGLGIPFNIASYGLLLEIIAKEVGMIPYELIGNLGDCHIYNNHIDGLKEQLTREPYPLPKICLDYREGEYNKDLTDLTPDDFVLFDYQSHLSIKLPLSN